MANVVNDSGGTPSSTDISGDHDPVHARTQGDIKGEVNRRVNQTRRGPEAGAGTGTPPEAPAAKEEVKHSSSENPVGNFFGGIGSGISNLWNQRPYKDTNTNPFSPVNWGKLQADNAWMTYQIGRKSYDTLTGFFNPDGGPYASSVHNFWEQNDAAHRFSQILASAAVQTAVPAATLPQLPGEIQATKDTLSGKMTDQKDEQTQRGIQERNVQQAPAGLAEAGQAALMPEGAAARALAFAGMPAAQAAMESNPNDMARNVAWAALTGMVLGGGHLPGPVREQLGKVFGKWPELEKFAQGMLQTNKQSARNAADPNSAHIQDYISQQLAKGGFPGTDKTLAQARKATDQAVTMIKTPEGDLIQKRDQREKDALKALNKWNVKSVGDVVSHAEKGMITGKYAEAVAKHWKDLGLPYDLKAHYGPDDPLRDPRTPLLEIHNSGNELLKDWATSHLDSVHHVLHQVQTGVFSATGSPMQSVLRSMAGLHGGTKHVIDHYLSTGTQLLGQSGVTGRKLVNAVEDRASYDALPAEAKMWVDGWRLISNSLRTQAKDTPYAEHFIGNFFPRMEMLGKDAARGGGSSLFKGPNKRHRAIQIGRNLEGQLFARPQFDSLTQAAEARKQSRTDFLQKVSDPLKDVPGGFKRDPEVKRLREMLATNPDEAKAGLEKVAKAAYPDLEMNPFKTIERYLHRQVSAVHSFQAIKQLENFHVNPDKKTGLGGMAAIPKTNDERLMKAYLDRGYKTVDNWRLENHLVHPKLADALGRYTNHVDNSKGLRGNAFFNTALKLERESLGMIMFSPAIHGINMAGRLGMGALMNPIQMTHYLLKGKGLTPGQEDRASFQLRQEAFNAGFMPHEGGRNFMNNLANVMHDAWGDTGDHMVEEAKDPQGKLRETLHKSVAWADPINDYFWKQINDFGVMMYHLEKKSAARHGLNEQEQRLWAARRANSWSGMVRPEDTNPLVHDLMRGAFFAPNWWRTWAELMVPIYKRSGVEMSPQMTRMAAYQGGKTIAAAVALQKLSGNALNLLFSGHLQKDNQPGNQDDIEMTAPWLDDFAKTDLSKAGPFIGVANPLGGAAAGAAQQLLQQNPAQGPHGGKRTAQNPLGRFPKDIEGAAGFQSGHPDWQPDDAMDGMTKFLVSRLSPVMAGAAAMTNVDLYRSATDRQLRGINPDEQALHPDWKNALYSAIYLSPLGSQFASQIASATSSGQDPNAQVDGPFGTKVPKSWDSIIKGLGGSMDRTLWSWITGTNPPYEHAQKSRGQPPGDDAYRNSREFSKQYHDEMGKASAEALGGVTTPNQWLSNYRQISAAHHNRMEAIYKNAPYYVNGPDGMLHDYEALGEQATSPDGSVDLGKLHQLQSEFRQQHSHEELQAMDQQLGASDQKYPMLKLYHQTTAAYGNFQEQWASSNGVDVGNLRQELSQYGALYGQGNASSKFLSQHRDLQRYEQAKRKWEATPAGLMYGMFYNSSTVSRYMQSHHLNAQQVVAEQPGVQTP